MIATLCERWGYTPEEAVAAPAWVWRLTAVLTAAQPNPEQAVG